jgi:hypothetical protein
MTEAVQQWGRWPTAEQNQGLCPVHRSFIAMSGSSGRGQVFLEADSTTNFGCACPVRTWDTTTANPPSVHSYFRPLSFRTVSLLQKLCIELTPFVKHSK